MSDVWEGVANANGFLNPALQSGLTELTQAGEVAFTVYQKYVLPLDGYVFWIAQSGFTASGSLHAAASRQQDEAEMLGVDRVWFTTSEPVSPFNVVSPTQLVVGTFRIRQGTPFRFAFSQRGPYFEQAGLFHYAGESINPVMETQLINDPTQLSTQTPIVSNSLPAWLALQSYIPVWLTPANPGITLFPSFLVADNEPPPYGAVHIEPGQTRALQSVPLRLPATTTHEQLASDRVRITLYGLTSTQAADFLDLVVQYVEDSNAGFGLMNTPVIRDEKRTQVEIMAIAMKKTIEFEVDYYQTRVNDIARQLIKSVSVAFAAASPFL